jgi:hypothetical protein
VGKIGRLISFYRRNRGGASRAGGVEERKSEKSNAIKSNSKYLVTRIVLPLWADLVVLPPLHSKPSLNHPRVNTHAHIEVSSGHAKNEIVPSLHTTGWTYISLLGLMDCPGRRKADNRLNVVNNKIRAVGSRFAPFYFLS